MEPVYIALDLETTGLNADTASIIEVGAVKFRGDQVLDTYQSFVKAKESIPIKITRLTGISDADLVGAPSFNKVGVELQKFIGSYPIVGHSIETDIRFLASYRFQVNQPSYDTFELATLLVPQLPNYSLITLAEHLKIQHPEAHRALADADVSRQVFVALLDRLAALPLSDIKAVATLTEKLDWNVGELFKDLAKRRVQSVWQAPSDHTPPPAIWPEPLAETATRTQLDEAEIGDFFGPSGALSRLFPGYESRPQQAQMSQAVARAFNQHDTILIEAGTGTGKSIGYLVPAAMYAVQNGQRVVISTNTINLQDQLATKDVPLLQTILQTADPELAPLKAVQLKGRANYLCLKRYGDVREQGDHAPHQAKMLAKVMLWMPETETGDRSELLLMRSEMAAWSSVNVDPDQCLRSNCPLYKECFYYKARKEADAAHLIIANHALVMSDLKSPGVLPQYQHIIIDEAHNLEDVATDHLGFQISQNDLEAFLEGFESQRKLKGLLVEWPDLLKLSTVSPQDRQKLERISEEIRPSLQRTRDSLKELFNQFASLMEADKSVTKYDPQLRITPKIRRRDIWETIEKQWNNVADSLLNITNQLRTFLQHLDSWKERDIRDYEGLLGRVRSMVQFGKNAQDHLDKLIFGDDETITWLSQSQRSAMITIKGAPLNLSPILREELWEKKQTNVLVSATFSIDQSFAYPKSQLGLETASELQLDSPFDYANSTLLYLPTDMPEPNERGYQRAVEDALIAACRASEGRALILFTSHQAMRQSYQGIQEALETSEIATLAQGIDGSRRSLIDRLKHDPRTILLGTSSFWEGVDVSGEALSVLIITKLPFNVPNDPIFSARSEQFNDAFMEYSIPQAILKFKQGFGRLIRSKSDRGIVIVLDRRLLSKNYGRIFIDSLPPSKVERGSLKDLAITTKKWLK